jgi:ferrous-iron efflux pump FieF
VQFLTNIPDFRIRQWAAYASVSVALILIVAKLAAYLATDSVALLSALIDSSVDLLAAVITLFGVRSALQPPDHDHRYGHGKAEPLAALTQSAFIGGSAVLLVYESLGRLFNPQLPQNVALAYGVLLLAIVLTTALVTFQNYVIRRTGSIAIAADRMHYRGDLMLNLAVIAALVLGQVTGSGLYDPLFAIGIATFLIYGATKIARDALDYLMDKELPDDAREHIRTIVMSHPEARGCHDLRTRSDGNCRFIELHLELDGHVTLARAHDITDDIEQRLRNGFPNAEILIHQEPAGIDDERLDKKIGL